MSLPKKPESTKGMSIDDVIGAQAKIREEVTGVPHTAQKASKINKVGSPLTQPASGLVAQGETLKQTQFNLPVSLNDRIARVAAAFHAGNRSHFVRAALERAVAEYEEKLK